MNLANLPFDSEAMLQGLRGWVECESPTWDTPAVNRMLDLAAREMAIMGAAIERIEPFAGCHPKCSAPVLAARLDVVAAQAQPIPFAMAVPRGLSRVRIQFAQSMSGGQPQVSTGILVDMPDCIGQVGHGLGADRIVDEDLGRWIKAIEAVFAAHP